MSPELHRWVEDTFGLEMVRILEGYSSLTAPVISPQLQERINRIVPNNYQGENVNLMFKQQFDVSCAPLNLYYTLPVEDISYSLFLDPLWDFGGFGNDFSAYASSIGGYVVQDQLWIPGGFDTGSALYFFYLGTSAPPDLVCFNPNTSATVTFPYYPYVLSNQCVYIPSTRWTNSPYLNLNLSGIIEYANLFSNYGGPLDFSLGALYNEGIIRAALTVRQPQATVSVIDDGGGFFTIIFQNLYLAYFPPLFSITYNANLNNDLVTPIFCP